MKRSWIFIAVFVGGIITPRIYPFYKEYQRHKWEQRTRVINKDAKELVNSFHAPYPESYRDTIQNYSARYIEYDERSFFNFAGNMYLNRKIKECDCDTSSEKRFIPDEDWYEKPAKPLPAGQRPAVLV